MFAGRYYGGQSPAEGRGNGEKGENHPAIQISLSSCNHFPPCPFPRLPPRFIFGVNFFSGARPFRSLSVRVGRPRSQSVTPHSLFSLDSSVLDVVDRHTREPQPLRGRGFREFPF